MLFEGWLINALNFLFPSLAVLLILLAQLRLMRVTASLAAGELKLAFQRHHRRMTIALALLAAWLIVQYLPLVYP
jgi:hypothetical protein